MAPFFQNSEKKKKNIFKITKTYFSLSFMKNWLKSSHKKSDALLFLEGFSSETLSCSCNLPFK